MSDLTRSWHELATAQKSAKGVSLYSKYVNRPLGRLLAVLAHGAGLGPNAVTAISAVTTLAGLAALVLLAPAAWTGALVAGLLVLGFALDSADGQVARLSGRSSPAGEWLDHLIDSGKMVCVHGAVLVAAYRFYGADPLWLLVPLGFQLTAVLAFSGMLLVTLLKRSRGIADAAGPPSLIRAIGLLPMDYGILAVTFALSGLPAVFMPVYTVLLALNVALTAALLVKWFRSLAAAPDGSASH